MRIFRLLLLILFIVPGCKTKVGYEKRAWSGGQGAKEAKRRNSAKLF